RLEDAGGPALSQESFAKYLAVAAKRWPIAAGLEGSDALAARIRHALVQRAPVDRATLSWRLLSLEAERRRLVFGARNRWVQLGAQPDGRERDDPDGCSAAVLLALDALFRDESWSADAKADPDGRGAQHARWALRSFARACALARAEAEV